MKRESRSKEAWCAWPVAPLRAPETSPTALPVGLFEVATTRFVVVDTETTGLEADARIVELAAAWVDVARGEVTEVKSLLIDPGMRIPRAASAIHGITDAMVKGAPRIDRALTRFFAYLEDGPVLAHNARFDVARLRFEAQRTASRVPGRLPVFCSMKMAKRAIPGQPSYRLDALASTLQLSRQGVAHRAGSDVGVAAKLVLRCLVEARKDLKDIVAQEDVL